MSGTLSPTVVGTPATTDVAARLLATMAALSGTATDYNIGSQIRTQAESLGSVVEVQSFWTQALVLQGMLYGAMALYGVPVPSATAATGLCTFATAFGSGAPPAAQTIGIPTSTIVSTAGGVQFSVSTSGVLAVGATGVTLPVVALQTGTLGNTASGTISNLVTSLGYPIQCLNPLPTGGGAAAGTYSQAVAAFAAKTATLGLCSPLAIADAAIGIASGGTTVQYASVYEPWANAGSGAASGQAGFVLYVDDGSGSASSALISAVAAQITGNVSLGESGYRPAGVPFSVQSNTPVFATVGVTGTLVPGIISSGTVVNLISQGITSYFATLQNSGVAQQPQVAAAAINAALGYYTSIQVALYNASGAVVTQLASNYNSRVVLGGTSINVM